MIKKYNFKVDSSGSSVTIKVPLAIYPRPTILHAAYHFIDEDRVILSGGRKNIAVTFIPEKKTGEAELAELAYEFNIQLISSFIESAESEKHAKVRDEMMRAAFSSPFSMPNRPPAASQPPAGEPHK